MKLHKYRLPQRYRTKGLAEVTAEIRDARRVKRLEQDYDRAWHKTIVVVENKLVYRDELDEVCE